jgi:hypothetical protein
VYLTGAVARTRPRGWNARVTIAREDDTERAQRRTAHSFRAAALRGLRSVRSSAA